MAGDVRFDVPLFGPSQVADILFLRRGRVRHWIDIITRLPRSVDDFDGVNIPFAGLVEARVIDELVRAGLHPRAIGEANEALKRDLGMANPLIWRNLAHDGKDILRPFEASWIRARDQQRGLPEVIEVGLNKVAIWKDDYPSQLLLTDKYGTEVRVDPEISGGHPVHWASGARVEDILGLVKAGDPKDVAAQEFGISLEDLDKLVLADYRRIAAAA